MEELKTRVQRKEENIVIYVAEMNTIFNRLSVKISEETRLKTIKKNLLPHYITALALHEVDSFDDLIGYCRKIDEAFELRRKVGLTPKVCSFSQKEVHKYYDKVDLSLSQDVENDNSDTPVVAGSSRNSSKSRVSSCWNCGDAKHLYRDCKRKRKIFCYKCGTPDTTVRQCKKCQGN